MENNSKLIGPALILALILGAVVGYSIRPMIAPSKKIVQVEDSNRVNTLQNIQTNNKSISYDLTAKEALKIAIDEALVWSKDSYVSEINLSSKKFASDGKSNGWKFVFYSKEKKKTYEIVIKDGESRSGEEKDAPEALQTLKGELNDSSALAKVFFENNPVETGIISLKMIYDAQSKKFIWIIFSNKGSHVMDAEI